MTRGLPALPNTDYGELTAGDRNPNHQIVDSSHTVAGYPRGPHQPRDLLPGVDDPVGGGTDPGNAETFALGDLPERGLRAEISDL